MPQTDDNFIRGTEYEEKFNAQARSEKLLSDLASLRRRLWDVRAKIDQLERMLMETQDLKAEAAHLQAQIDATAGEIRLVADGG